MAEHELTSLEAYFRIVCKKPTLKALLHPPKAIEVQVSQRKGSHDIFLYVVLFAIEDFSNLLA